MIKFTLVGEDYHNYHEVSMSSNSMFPPVLPPLSTSKLWELIGHFNSRYNLLRCLFISWKSNHRSTLVYTLTSDLELHNLQNSFLLFELLNSCQLGVEAPDTYYSLPWCP